MKIETTEFDASRHVLQGRDGEDGRERFFTIGSIVAAERPLEAQHEAVAIDALRGEIEALKNRALPDNMVALIQEQLPPASLTQETMAVLAELAKAQLQTKQDLTALSQKVEVIASTLLKMGDRLGG